MKRRSTTALSLGGLLLLPLLAYSDILLGVRGLYLEDLIGYHFPMKHIVAEAVRSGEFPYWNPFYSAGQPLAANPAYELFYPLQWLVYVLPFAYAFQLHIVLHFVIAAIGAFFLIRSFGVKPLPSAIGAAAFVFSGPYLSLSAKLPILFAVSWMPLVLLLVKRLIQAPSKRTLSAAALVAGVQLVIGEPTMVMQTWAIIAVYSVYRMVARLPGGRVATRRPGHLATWQPIVSVIACGVLATLIAAVQILPALDFARDTVRSRGLPYNSVSNWSLPFERLEELAMPSLFWHVNVDGQPAMRTLYRDRLVPFLGTIYCGAFFILIAIAGIFAAVRGRWWFLGAFTASVLVAAGEHTPLLKLLYDAGLVSAIRYPEKFLLAGALALAVWSAIVIEKLLDGDRETTRSACILAAAWVAITLIAAWSGNDKTYFWMLVARAAAVLAVLLLVRVRRAIWSVALLATVSLGELWLGTRSAAPRMPRAYFDPPALETELKAFGGARVFHDAQWFAGTGNELANEYFGQSGRDRFWWVDRNGEFLNLAAAWGHPLALEDDVDYTSLKNTSDFRQAFNAAHAKRVASAGDPYLRMANAGVRLSFRTLDEAANKMLVSDPAHFTPVVPTPIETNSRYAFASRLEHIDSNDELGAAIESHPPEGVVAYVNAETFQPAGGDVLRVDEKRNSVRLDVRTAGRAFLVLSVTGHKYWTATIDSQKAPIVPTNVAFQGVVVPAGTHTVELRYRNPLVAIGGAITLLTLVVLALVTKRAG